MPLSSAGEIPYHHARMEGGIQFQANPPMCNRCWQEITRQNVGRTSVVHNAYTHGRFEFIECTACTAACVGTALLTQFWTQHAL